MGDTRKGNPLTACMDVYKAKLQSDEILDKLMLIIVVRGELKKRR